jgi:serine/threonine-protein kinase
MTLSPSRTAEEYEFLGIIAKPKAGVTYKVRNRSTGEFEALRILPGASAGDPESRDRFLREIRIHTRLAHPNIAAFHDAFELDGQLVMTAECIEGSTLSQLCANGPLAIVEAIRIVGEVLSALEEAHALGIVHRAITSDHVHITPNGHVKLDGFGLAKPVSDINLTQTGVMLGDPRYISPEQVMGVQPLDHRSDLYSVAIVLYQALTQKVPFDSANDFDIMVEQVRSIPRPPSELNPEIPPALDRLVLTMLAKQPENRLSNARAFREALAEITPRPAQTIVAPVSVPATATQETQENTPTDPGVAGQLLALRFFSPVVIFGIISLTIILTVLLYVTQH